jgi:hypothetical protein
MKISQTPQPTIPALAPKKRVEAVKVRRAVGAGLQDYLKQNPSGVPLGGPSGWVAANAGLSLGAPVLVGRGFEFLPLFNPNSATDVISAVSKAAESPSIGRMEDVVDKALELVEQFPDLPHDLEFTVHLVGLARPVANAVTVLKKPGPKNKVEVNRAVVQCLAGLVRLVADLPGLESAKPYTNGLYLVLKVGEEFFALPHTEIIPAGPGDSPMLSQDHASGAAKQLRPR